MNASRFPLVFIAAAMFIVTVKPAEAQVIIRRVTNSATVPANSDGAVNALCGAGEVVTGGGHTIQGTGPVVVTQSAPFLPAQWAVQVHNSTANTITIFAAALCVPGISR